MGPAQAQARSRRCHADNLRCIEFTPDAKESLSGNDESDDGTVKCWSEPVQNHSDSGVSSARGAVFLCLLSTAI